MTRCTTRSWPLLGAEPTVPSGGDRCMNRSSINREINRTPEAKVAVLARGSSRQRIEGPEAWTPRSTQAQPIGQVSRLEPSPIPIRGTSCASSYGLWAGGGMGLVLVGQQIKSGAACQSVKKRSFCKNNRLFSGRIPNRLLSFSTSRGKENAGATATSDSHLEMVHDCGLFSTILFSHEKRPVIRLTIALRLAGRRCQNRFKRNELLLVSRRVTHYIGASGKPARSPATRYLVQLPLEIHLQ
jgi:hypothetical protein